MDSTAAAAAGSRIKTVNILVSSSTTRSMANTTNLIQIQPAFTSTRKEMLPLYTCNKSFPGRYQSHNIRSYPYLSSRNGSMHSISCSMKPRIDKNNATNKNPATELDQNSMTPNVGMSPPNPPATSTSSRGLVFDLSPTNSWDHAEIGSPVVKRFIGDNEERWYMWYHGRCDSDGSDSIGLAVSSNGVHWARGGERVRSCADAGTVMNCSNSWWAFDTESIRPSEMVIMSSPMYSAVYWLYYTGYSSEEVNFSGELPNISIANPERFISDKNDGESYTKGRILKSLPGLACSQDGRHWARIEGDHHSGALLDVGSDKEWDSLFIAAPHVIVHENNDLRMYYYSFDRENGQFAIGLARSRDGIRWVKYGKILGGGSRGSFDEYGVKNACVVRNRGEGNYLMTYEGVAADGRRSIGMAVSEDGLKNWRRLQEGPVLKPSEDDGWDNKGVGSPCLVQVENSTHEWRLYYGGYGGGGRTGIGMAVSDGSSVRTFRRWSGFCL